MMTVDDSGSVSGGSRGTESRAGRGRWPLVLGAAALMLLALVFPFPVDGRLWSQLFDLAHGPAFCCLLLVVAGFIDPGSIGLPQRFSVLRHVGTGEILVLSGGCLMLGSVGELLQGFAGRSPGVADLIANSLGVLSGACWMFSRQADGRCRSLLAVCSLLVLLSAVVRPVAGIRGAILQQNDFPLLASYERRIDLGAWTENRSTMQQSTDWSSDGRYSLKVELSSGRYSGVNMIWPLRDWRGYDRLSWDVRNPGSAPIVMLLKIYDRQHRLSGFESNDRFEQIVEIPADGEHELTVDLSEIESAPATRTMDLSRINGVELFAIDRTTPATLYLDNMRLVKSSPHRSTDPSADRP